MGLFFRKKKIAVPLPPSEDLLKFPKPSEIKVLKPEAREERKIKKAEDIEKLPFSLPELPKRMGIPSPPFPFKPVFPSRPPEMFSFIQGPFFIRLQHYQMLLDNLNCIKTKTMDLDQTTERLEKSEFNENKDYERLKNDLKKLHDRLLFMDDLIFKK